MDVSFKFKIDGKVNYEVPPIIGTVQEMKVGSDGGLVVYVGWPDPQWDGSRYDAGGEVGQWFRESDLVEAAQDAEFSCGPKRIGKTMEFGE